MLGFSNQSNAQELILFQIPSSAPQIKIAAKAGDTKSVALYKRSDNQIKTAIIKSFYNEFDYCPVFFFMTEDYDAVLAKEFDKVTFYNHAGKQALLPADLKDYKIANIRFFPKELNSTTVDGKEVYQETTEDRFGKGIILNNDQFEPVKGRLRFTPCKIMKRGSFLSPKNRYYVFRGVGAFNRKVHKIGLLANPID